MTYEIETFKKVNGALTSVSKSLTDDLNWAIDTEIEAHELGDLLAQSKGSGTLLFQNGRVIYKKLP